MKTSFISSLSVQTAMRNSIASVQRDMVQANQEAVSQKHADMGVALGANTSRALDLSRDITRIESLHSTAALATQRLDTAELSLKGINDLGAGVQKAMIALGGSASETNLATARQAVSDALDAYTNYVNTSVQGEYIFSGINSDVKPLANYFDATPGGPKAAVQAEFNSFLTANGMTDASQMTAAQMTTFLDGLEAKFNGTSTATYPPAGKPFWETYFSNASNENMKSRISGTEVVESSTNANSLGMRNFAFSTIISMEFLQANVSKDARDVVSTRTTTVISRALDGPDSIKQQRTVIGLATERVTKAEESLQAQKDILTKGLGAMENVDAAEAATRLNSMKTLLETAYSVTAKIQQLSLVNYL